ncbi:uncharacterized protein LOC142333702 [Lycorma delicatula]|uniref:uncharacterized protein LOC142333702 n=1 Tax=Lycorma delicatula TaxID=130591 RepID=UPI003F51437A
MDIDVITRSIDRGASINDVDLQGISPLLRSIKCKRDINFIKEILEKGANVNQICDDNDENTILHLAVSDFRDDYDDLKIIKLLIDFGADINARNRAGEIPLMRAVSSTDEDLWFELIDRGSRVESNILLRVLCKNRSKRFIRKLIANGADVNAVDKEKYSPLFLALKNNLGYECIYGLMEEGADVNAYRCFNADEGDDDDVNTPLIMALYADTDKEIICALIDNGADANKSSNSGITPLLCAIDNDYNVEVIDKLIDNETDIGKSAFDGITPLMSALIKNDKEIVCRLVDLGADVNAVDYHGRTVLYCAVMYTFDQEIIDLLVNKGADTFNINECHDRFWFDIAFKKNDEKFVAEIVYNADNFNVTNETGQTLLTHALELRTSRNIIYDIIRNGADINSPNDYGFTPLVCATMTDRDLEIVIKFIESGANVNYQDEKGRTALMYAFYSPVFKRLVKIFTDKGADINIRDNDGQTLLMTVLDDINDKEYVEVLIEHGADVNTKNDKGQTPLMYAVRCYKDANKDVIDSLIEHGADVNAVDDDGRTALFYASSVGTDEIFQSLLDRGASVHQTLINLRESETPLIDAIRGERDVRTVIEFLGGKEDVNEIDQSGTTFLMRLVSAHKYKRLAVTLIRDRLIALKKDLRQITDILSCAVDVNFMNTLMRLFGTDINNKDDDGRTPLMRAIINKRDVKFIRNMIDEGADPKHLDNELNSALHFAYSDKIVKTLIIHDDVDVTAKNIYGETPLQRAVNRNDWSELLVVTEYNNNPNAFIPHLVLASSKEIDDNYDAGNYNLFINICKAEVDKMKRTNITERLSFYQFCRKLPKTEKILISKSQYLYDRAQITEVFPVYSDIIITTTKKYTTDISKIELINRLRRLYIEIKCDRKENTNRPSPSRSLMRCHRHSDSDCTCESTFLGYDILFWISKYLNYRQIVNLFLSSE